MSFSYLGQHELAHLTQKLILAAARVNEAKTHRKQALADKMEELQGKLEHLESQGPSERLNELKERLGRLNSTLKGP